MDQHGNEQILVGINLARGTKVLRQSTWGLIEEVVVLTPSKVGQFALGWHGDRSTTRSSYDVVAKFSGDSNDASDVMEDSQKA